MGSNPIPSAVGAQVSRQSARPLAWGSGTAVIPGADRRRTGGVFNVGAGELFVILAVALVVLGPNRLPEAVRTAGKVVGEVRRITGGFQQELRSALEDDGSDRADRADRTDGIDAGDDGLD